ncbi:hypothetical protein [Halosaccharopolyspora lacisalsi]|uniref:hypothetical protein n=1 Tax=Halosaccharopolyspora lacisalsi TaxID=1000566 RepID=UPI0015F79D91|nr:hypothetical protein [Halosaccharopolyspora lacisalsi]
MSLPSSTLSHRERVTVWLGTAVWIGGMLTVSVMFLLSGDDVVRAVVGALAAVAIVGFLSVAVIIGRSALRQEGVERSLHIESSALAFWITMGVAFSYMILQPVAQLPQAQPYMVVGLGAVSWALAHGARSEKYL